jgi:hypothetical protein
MVKTLISPAPSNAAVPPPPSNENSGAVTNTPTMLSRAAAITETATSPPASEL